MEATQSKCQNCRVSQHFQRDSSYSVSKQSSQSPPIYIKCSRCQIIQCKQCFKQHVAERHLSSLLQGNENNQQPGHPREVICQECQQNDSNKFCQNCEQHLCDRCSFRIHNKGKRAKHHLLDNDVLIRIEKLFFTNETENQDFFHGLSQEFNPSNCLVVYGPKRPTFIQDFEGLQIQDMNKLTIQQIQSCLNRYPLISLFSVNCLDRRLTQLLMGVSIQSQFFQTQDFEQQNNLIFLNGFKISLQVRKNYKQYNSQSQAFLQDQYQDKVQQSSSQNNRSNAQIHSPQQNKFRKKQSVDFSCGSKQQSQQIPEMKSLFKKSLKMSNRSLIIQIPQAKQYKQSPIKSDRQQGFIQRNLNLLQNASKGEEGFNNLNRQNKLKKQCNQKHDKTITIHLDENYNDLSSSTMNLLEHCLDKSNNEESFLLLGSVQASNERDASFRIIGNDQSAYSDLGNNSQEEQDNPGASFSLLNAGSLCMSTDNSSRRRSKKPPIPYFQPMKSKNAQNLNNSSGCMSTQKARLKLQNRFRQLAQEGQLMISRERLQQLKLPVDDRIIRKMRKAVCDKEIEYFALSLQVISIQSICWVLESIKEDRMMPSQKLILSRLKQSYNIKPAHKLWVCIIKYLESSQYFADKQDYDRYKLLPSIFVGKQTNQQILLEYQNKWPYEDQQQPTDPESQQWQMFKLVLNEYFMKNKQITGGRYGCVQYVKLNGPYKLRQCSLGRLSYFVQQAINKGLIRYHKTLLIQNNQSSEKSFYLQNNNMKLFDLQKQLKVLIIQVSLIDIFLQAGMQTQISLAQIPLTFKKTILFDVNLLQLGFPKLKNILQTLTDKLTLSSSKSHIKYQSIKSNIKIEQLKIKHQQLLQYFISQMSEIIYSCMLNRHNIIVQQLYDLTNEKLGFVFDFRVCNVPDFYQFLIYYCHQVINLQFINGTFVAFPKHNMGYVGGYQYPSQINQHNMYYQPNYQNGVGNINGNYYYHHTQHHLQMPLNQNPAYQQQFPLNHHMNNKYEINHQQQNQQFIGFPASNINSYIPSAEYPPYNMPPSMNFPLHYQQKQSQLPIKKANNKPQHRKPSLPLPPQPTEISTPKFNESIEYINQNTNQKNIKTLQNFKWQSYLDVIGNFDESQQKNFINYQTQSFTDYRSIYNILDDDNSQVKSKISLPKTFIQKDGSCNNNQGELYISKITPIDQISDRDEQCDGSLGLFDQSPSKDTKHNLLNNQKTKNSKRQKGQHNRVYSTTQARTKHERMYSTTTAKN